jgi:putative membrane protein
LSFITYLAHGKKFAAGGDRRYNASTEGCAMVLILHWLLSALSILIVAHVVPGFEVRGFGTALLAAVVIGLVNATLGFVLKILTLPVTILTFGLFLIVINALMLLFAAMLVPGFAVHGFGPALLGAIVLSVVSFVLRFLVFSL